MNLILTILTLAGLVAAPQSDGPAVNDNCPIGKQAIDGQTFVEWNGHKVGFCCAGCDTKFLAWSDADKAAWVQLALADREPGSAERGAADEQKQEPSQRDAAQAEAFTGDPWALAICPVSGKPLDTMGEPVVLEVDGREVRLCCKQCVGKLREQGDKLLAAAEAKMIADQRPHYPLKTCLVSGEPLFEKGVFVGEEVVVHNRLFRVCCDRCAAKVNKDPAPWFAKLDGAVHKAQAEDYPLAHCLARPKNRLGSMGKPDEIVVANRLVRFCCDSCRKTFRAKPAAHLARLDAARASKAAKAKAAERPESAEEPQQ